FLGGRREDHARNAQAKEWQRQLHVRAAQFQRRARPVPLPRRPLPRRAVLRADRTPAMRPDAHAVGMQPRAGKGRLPAADHAQYRQRQSHRRAAGRLLAVPAGAIQPDDDGWLRSNPAILELLRKVDISTELRGDNIFALARKTGAPIERYPKELYIE